VGLEINGRVLARSPIRRIDFSDPADKARHDEITRLVRRMLDLNGRLALTTSTDEKAALRRRLDTTDQAIDGLVYQLYGLTGAQIALVEATVGVQASA
jgi:hypothetical protein